MATTTIAVSQQDITSADAFLAQYLTESVGAGANGGDFSPGTALRDLTVGALARVFAFLRSEIATSRSMQSIKQLQALPSSTDRDEAADSILSNLFLVRNPGRQAHVQAVLHLSRAADVTISVSTRFFRTTSLAFVLDGSATLTIPASELVPTFNSDGTVKDYVTTVALKASAIGTAYNLTAGRFYGADVFNPFFLYAEHLVDIHDGRDLQSTDEMISSAPDGLSTRNLVNAKSISAVLKSAFSDISRLVSIGFGDPEMIRDHVGDGVLSMHVGGMYDVYVDLPRTVVTETLSIAAQYARPDGLTTMFRDLSVPMAFTGVTAGMVLRIYDGLPDAPRSYLILANNTNTELEVWSRTPFQRPTDEDASPVGITYSVGAYSPGFADVIAVRTTGVTSRKQSTPYAVTLTGQPQYGIKSVALIDGATTTQLGPRVNGAPTGLEYQVITRNPEQGQSGRALTQVIVSASNPALPIIPSTASLAVSYDTLTDYSSVAAVVTDTFTRTICANALVKGFHPIYVSAAITYDVATGTSEAEIPTPEAVAAAVVQLINNFPSTDALTTSYISTYLTRNFPFAGVYPITLYYTLIAPDGQVYEYSTKDVALIVPDDTHTAQVTNGSSLRVPVPDASLPVLPANAAKITAANNLIRGQLLALGISDRTVRYFADSGDITCSPR